jgi:uncharacterized phage protein gp47/JayE
MAGITPEGFTAKTIEEIKGELEADQLETIDPALNLAADQPVGQLNAAVSKKIAEVWELVAVAYNAFNRDAAEDRLLDNVGSLTGTPRLGKTRTEVTCTCNLNGGFSALPGTMMANVLTEPTLQFTNRDTVNAGFGTGYYPDIVFESVSYGPIEVNSGTLTQITAAVTGWNSVTNPLDGIPGTLTETNEDYRQRQTDELTAVGSSTVDAIRTDLLKVKHVLQAYCFENVTLFTDVNGVPGKAIECVIYDGAAPTASDTEIAQAIWDSKPSGSETYGSTTANAIDSLGIVRPVKFSRAAVTNIYLEYDVSVDAAKFPVDGVALIKAAAVEKGNELNLDGDVIALALRACVLSPVVAGVTDVVALRLGLAASPVGTANIVISGRAIARFDTSRVVVNLV